MFYANLGVLPRKLSGHVMNKRVVLDTATMVELFDIDGTPLKILGKDHPRYSKEEAVKLLFPSKKDYMSSEKILTSSLPIKDRLLHFTIVKYILPQFTNTTIMVEYELFMLWALKTGF